MLSDAQIAADAGQPWERTQIEHHIDAIEPLLVNLGLPEIFAISLVTVHLETDCLSKKANFARELLAIATADRERQKLSVQGLSHRLAALVPEAMHQTGPEPYVPVSSLVLLGIDPYQATGSCVDRDGLILERSEADGRHDSTAAKDVVSYVQPIIRRWLLFLEHYAPLEMDNDGPHLASPSTGRRIVEDDRHTSESSTGALAPPKATERGVHDPKSRKQARNDYLLELFLKNPECVTYGSLATHLDKVAATRNWESLDQSSIRGALIEAYERINGQKWPYDGRGKKKQPTTRGNKEIRK